MNQRPFFLLLGGIFSLMIAMGIGRFAYTPILPLMQNALSFSDEVAGYLASSNYAGYLVGAVMAGLLPLIKHKNYYLRLSLLISILTTLLMGLTHSIILMVVYRFISGVASAFIFVLASSIVLDKLALTGKTNWAGLFYAGVGFGIFLSGAVIPNLHHFFKWEGVWIGLAFVCVLLAIFVWLWLKESPNKSRKQDTQGISTQVQGPPGKWFPWLLSAYGLEGLGYIVTGTFIVSIAERTSTFHSDPTLVWMVVGVAAIPSCIIWSTLANKIGFVTSLVMAMTLQAIGIVLPVISMSEISLLISALLFGATFMGITTLATTLARQMSPTNSSQTIGYLTALYALGQVIGPTLAGILAYYTGSYHFALLGAAGVVLIGAILLVSGIRYDQAANADILPFKTN